VSYEDDRRAAYYRPHPIQITLEALARRKKWPYGKPEDVEHPSLETSISIPIGQREYVVLDLCRMSYEDAVATDEYGTEVSFSWEVTELDPDDVQRAIVAKLEALLKVLRGAAEKPR